MVPGCRWRCRHPRALGRAVGAVSHACFSSPLKLLTISYFGLKKKVSFPGPVHLHLWREHSCFHLTTLQALHPVPGLLLGLKAPGAV